MRKWILALAMLVAGSAQAALISVTAESGWSCSTGGGEGFEPGCTPDAERGMMNFVYNTSTADSDPDPTRGVYAGALVAFTMTVEQQTRPDLFFTLAPGSNALLVYFWGEKGVTLEFTATEQSGAYGDSSDMFFRLNVGNAGFHSDDSIPLVSYWERAFAYVGYAGAVGETDWAVGFRAVEIPLPNTLALTGLGLFLAARCRKLQGRRETIDS